MALAFRSVGGAVILIERRVNVGQEVNVFTRFTLIAMCCLRYGIPLSSSAMA